MTMVSSGPISLAGTATSGGKNESVEVELGGTGTASINANQANVRGLAGVPSGTIALNEFYGKSNITYINLTIAANTQNYDVWANTAPNPAYVAGRTAVTVTINPGVVVGSSSTSAYAMSVPTSFNPGDTVTIVNSGGYIVGAGGAGGAGGAAAGSGPTVAPGHPGNPGGAGGAALYVTRPTTVTNNGTIGGGGGGGGGAGANHATDGGGGGGGAGYTAGGGGAAGNPAYVDNVPSTSGTLTAGGSGGGYRTPAGVPIPADFKAGSGGSLGAAGGGGGALPPPYPGGGSSGGAGGNYIVGNSYVTWPATGTRLGGAS